MADIILNAQLQFQSNSTRDQGCHLIIMQFLKDDGTVLNDTPSGCPLKMFAIRLKNVASNCNYLPDNQNPFIYNFNNSTNPFQVQDCLLNGCVRKVRIIVIPCCRSTLDLSSMTWVTDSNNPNFEINSTAISCTNYQNYIPNNGGYAQMDVEIQNPTWHRCRKYSVWGDVLNNILTNTSYTKCTGGNGTINPVSTGCSNQTDLLNSIYIPFDYSIKICANTISNSINLINLDDITDRYTECCNCVTGTISLLQGFNQFIIFYQSCDGDNIVNTNTSGGSNISIPCHRKGSLFVIGYNIDTQTGNCSNGQLITNYTVTYNTCSNYCNDLFI